MNILESCVIFGCENCRMNKNDGHIYSIGNCPHYNQQLEEKKRCEERASAMREYLERDPSKSEKRNYVLYDSSGRGRYYVNGRICYFLSQAEKFTLDEALVVSRKEGFYGYHWKVIRVG